MHIARTHRIRLLVALLVGCSDPPPPAPVVPTPPVQPVVEPPAPPPEPAPEPPPAAVEPGITATYAGFPIWAAQRVVDGAHTPVPAGQEVVDVAIHPTGEWAAVVTRDTDRDNVQWHRWDFQSPLEAIPGPPLDDARVHDVAWSPHDGSVVVAAGVGGGHALLHCPSLDTSTCTPILETEGRLTDLRVPLLLWAGEARAFATLTTERSSRVVTVRVNGDAPYEVTHPSGRLSPLSSRSFAGAEPHVMRMASARLLDLDPSTGDLLFATPDRARRIEWDPIADNWKGRPRNEDALADVASGELRASPNGWLRWLRTGSELRLVDRNGTLRDTLTVSPDSTLHAVAPLGRCAVLSDPTMLRTACTHHIAARVRHLTTVPEAAVDPLLDSGLVYLDRQDLSAPPFVSIDSVLDVLHAGVRAVEGVRTEQVELPALLALLEAMATGAPDDRVRTGARAAAHILEDPGSRRRMERAIKGIRDLQLTDAERTPLSEQPEVQAAWTAWMEARAPLSPGSVDQGLFGTTPLPPWVDPACVSTRRRSIAPAPHGLDRELRRRLTHQENADCGVPERPGPSPLDLLAVLGDRRAKALLLTSPEGRFDGLPEALDAVSSRTLDVPGVDGAWLDVVRAVSTSEAWPASVDRTLWHRRRMETATTTWEEYRAHAKAPSTKPPQLADPPQPIGFEALRLPPQTGVVDPMPRAWLEVVTLAELLVGLVPAQEHELVALLTETADRARTLAAMAEAQHAGLPLSADQYTQLDHHTEWCEGTAAALWSRVDEHDRDQAGRRVVSVLLDDRGVLVPAQGQVGAYRPRRSSANASWLNPGP